MHKNTKYGIDCNLLFLEIIVIAPEHLFVSWLGVVYFELKDGKMQVPGNNKPYFLTLIPTCTTFVHFGIAPVKVNVYI